MHKGISDFAEMAHIPSPESYDAPSTNLLRNCGLNAYKYDRGRLGEELILPIPP